VDFHDLEQFALRVLREFSGAEKWRQQLRFVFVDEYQDINAAQDQIIAALSGEGELANRFLVGDIKQSIYRFRLADPKIFRDYAHNWHGAVGQTIALSENFRSCESLLTFTNSVCRLVLREEVGGVSYGPEAELKFGAPAARAAFSTANNAAPRVELLIRHKTKRSEATDEEDSLADLDDAQREARLVAQQLKQLVHNQTPVWEEATKQFRPAMWRDLAILLRSPRAKSEIYVKEFERAGIPLAVARGGFYDSAEILDLLSLLRLLDNPLQDVPCIAVLRSPLVGLSLDELAEIRLAASDKHFWTALVRIHNPECRIETSAAAKVSKFLESFGRWRQMAKHVSLSECLEAVLAETHYADWLCNQPRGERRAANIEAFVQLAQQFDQFQRQGLFRFLKLIEAQQETETEPEVAPTVSENAVRLMSIHQSKGLEFPVVVLADLAKSFNEQDLHGEIIFDEEFGLCPKVKPPSGGRRYPSLPHWLAQRRQERELRGEELRLLYVALTRARDYLILAASISEKKWDEVWTKPATVTPQKIAAAKSFADWLALWFAQHVGVPNADAGETPLLRWRIARDAELVENSVATDVAAPNIQPEQTMFDATALARLREILSWNYPQNAATRHKAKSSVTELRRAVEELDEEAEPMVKVGWPSKQQVVNSKQQLSAAAIGVAHHKYLQHVALENTGDLAAEAERLVQERFLTVEESAALNLAALGQFWNSPLGHKIRQQAQFVRRELPFTARFSAAEAAQIIGKTGTLGLENEFLVVQGVADLAVLLPGEIWLVDFKTDAVKANELAAKVKTYTPQLQFYAAALNKIFGRRVTKCALHFFAVQRTEPVTLT
jgi:ATP-dependent helicase/nuclease subunit A